MPQTIQRVELSLTNIPIHCPFCGQRVLGYAGSDEDPSQESQVHPCPHTLFVAHDEGFEYRSARFNDAMGLPTDEDPFPDIGDDSYDSFTDKVSIADALKFASYVPAPSGFGAYVGFAPII